MRQQRNKERFREPLRTLGEREVIVAGFAPQNPTKGRQNDVVIVVEGEGKKSQKKCFWLECLQVFTLC